MLNSLLKFWQIKWFSDRAMSGKTTDTQRGHYTLNYWSNLTWIYIDCVPTKLFHILVRFVGIFQTGTICCFKKIGVLKVYHNSVKLLFDCNFYCWNRNMKERLFSYLWIIYKIKWIKDTFPRISAPLALAPTLSLGNYICAKELFLGITVIRKSTL